MRSVEEQLPLLMRGVEYGDEGVRQAMESEQMKRKMEDSGQGLRFMDAAQYTALWAETEAKIKPLMSLAK